MAIIPEKKYDTKVEKLIEGEKVKGEVRSYLGISGIGDDCILNMWFNFRICAFEWHTPREVRLLSRGHKEEPIIIEDLESIGIVVSGLQDEIITGSGHIKGHVDGIGSNIPDAPKTVHLLEFKTANDKNFAKFKKTKNLKESSPLYYGQCVCYMQKLKLKKTLFVVVNKNTDERYYERINADNKHAKYLFERGFSVISTEVPPERPYPPTYYRCKWCKNYEICHFGGPIEKHCRTCQFGDVCDDGKWQCGRTEKELSFKEQLEGCDNYVLLQTLKDF